RTTIADPAANRGQDLVARQFCPLAPDRLWVADFTYVSTWSGWVYVAFVIDAYARRILGWAASTSMTTCFVLAAFEQAVWTRNRHGQADFSALVHHHDKGAQYTSLRFGQALAQAGIADSVDVEMRVSWTPETPADGPPEDVIDLAPHFAAWTA